MPPAELEKVIQIIDDAETMYCKSDESKEGDSQTEPQPSWLLSADEEVG